MRRILMLFGAAFVAGLIIVVGSAAGERFMAVPDRQGTDSVPAPAPEEPAAFTEFRDEEFGFAVSYPSSWERIRVTDPNVRLVATPNGLDSILVRVVTLDVEVRDEDLASVRTFTDEIVLGGDGVELLAEPSGVELGGLSGLYYVYTFTDPSGREGVHLHYFLFDGDTMLTIVLQALPVERLEPLTPTFQTVIESFETPST